TFTTGPGTPSKGSRAFARPALAEAVQHPGAEHVPGDEGSAAWPEARAGVVPAFVQHRGPLEGVRPEPPVLHRQLSRLGAEPVPGEPLRQVVAGEHPDRSAPVGDGPPALLLEVVEEHPR